MLIFTPIYLLSLVMGYASHTRAIMHCTNTTIEHNVKKNLTRHCSPTSRAIDVIRCINNYSSIQQTIAVVRTCLCLHFNSLQQNQSLAFSYFAGWRIELP